MLEKTSDINKTNKTAQGIVNTLNPDNRYNEAIVSAALRMVERKQGDWKYQTQYSSGSTVWHSPEKDYKACTLEFEQICF